MPALALPDGSEERYGGGALVFSAGLTIIAGLYFLTKVSRVSLFWAAFILIRPLGATVGDFLDKPLNHGGLNLSRPLASAVIAVFILLCLLLLPQKAGRHPEQSKRFVVELTLNRKEIKRCLPDLLLHF
jgi:uncharacterized membrane-anchored protein